MILIYKVPSYHYSINFVCITVIYVIYLSILLKLTQEINIYLLWSSEFTMCKKFPQFLTEEEITYPILAPRWVMFFFLQNSELMCTKNIVITVNPIQ